MFYTYAHYKPQGGIFYIGKGSANRAYILNKRNIHWNRVVAKHGKPHIEILAHWKTEAEAFDHEKLLISCFKDMGVALTNFTNGGEGTSGYKLTDDQRLKISVSKIGKPAPNKGMPMSEEQKAKLSKARKGKSGTPMSAENRARMSALRKGKPATNKGKPMSEEQKLKISLANKGKPATRKGAKHTDEAKAKMKATKMKNKELRSNP